MKARKVLLIGDSHIYAIQAALKNHRLVPPDVDFEALRLGSPRKEKIIGDVVIEGAVEKVKGLAVDDLFVALLRGNQFNTMGLIQHPQPFDVLLPGDSADALQPDAEIIPLQVLRNYFTESLASGYGKQLLQLKRNCSARVVCLAPPAPKEDAEHIMKGAETYFRDLGISEIGVTPAIVRLKLWTLQQQALEAFCLKHGMIYLDNPVGTRNEAGYLDRKYYAGDATHGNKEYGSKVLWQVAGLLGVDA